MKKITLITIILFISLFVSAQKTEKDVDYGFKIGMNVSSLNGDSYLFEDNSSKAGINFGVWLEKYMENNLSLQLELLYNQMGARTEVETFETDYFFYNKKNNVTITYSYLSIPIILKYYPQKKFNFYAGLQLSTLMSDKVDCDNEKAKDRMEEPENLDVNLLLGFEIKIKDKFALGMRYAHALSAVAEDCKNSCFSLNFAYVF